MSVSLFKESPGILHHEFIVVVTGKSGETAAALVGSLARIVKSNTC